MMCVCVCGVCVLILDRGTGSWMDYIGFVQDIMGKIGTDDRSILRGKLCILLRVCMLRVVFVEENEELSLYVVDGCKMGSCTDYRIEKNGKRMHKV